MSQSIENISVLCNANQWLNVWSVYFHFNTLSCQNQGERQYSKAKGWTDFFSYVACFRSEDLSNVFLEVHKKCVNNRY